MDKLIAIKTLKKKILKQNKKTVLCHGVFDLLHTGHIDHFIEAKRKVENYNFQNIFKKGLNAEYLRVDGNDFTKVYENTKKLRIKF